MIQSGPQTIISQGADWRFLNLMVPHSVPSVDDFFQDRTRSDKNIFIERCNPWRVVRYQPRI